LPGALAEQTRLSARPRGRHAEVGASELDARVASQSLSGNPDGLRVGVVSHKRRDFNAPVPGGLARGQQKLAVAAGGSRIRAAGAGPRAEKALAARKAASSGGVYTTPADFLGSARCLSVRLNETMTTPSLT